VRALRKFVCWLTGHHLHSETISELVWLPGMQRTEERERYTLTCDRCGRWFE